MNHALRQRFNTLMNGIVVPKDIHHLTDIDPNEVETEYRPSVETLWSHMLAVFRSGMHPFISLAVRHRGELIMNRSVGYAELGDEHPDDSVIGNIDTPVCLFSGSKAISAMLVHKLAEDGLVNLLRPVSDYLPEFGINGKEDVTLYQMLCHRSGFGVIDQEIDPNVLTDEKAVFELVCQLPRQDDMGRDSAYHGITSGFVIAELIHRLTGLTANEYMTKTFREPMGMTNFQYGYHGTSEEAVAHNYNTGGPRVGFFLNHLQKVLGLPFEEIVEFSNTETFMSSTVPSGNLYATAEEGSRFYQMMLDGGVWQGQQLLQQSSIDIATRETGGFKIDKALGMPMRYSLGMMLGGDPIGMYGKKTGKAYGHLGLSNVMVFADPERDLAISLMTSGKPVIGAHLLSFGKLMMGLTGEFPRREEADYAIA